LSSSTPSAEYGAAWAEYAKAQAEQIRWVDAADVGERVGTLPPAILLALNDAIRLHLSL
jgi:mRNA-degrading endonuclease toxin of MazEF toxin-antitoxin module